MLYLLDTNVVAIYLNRRSQLLTEQIRSDRSDRYRRLFRGEI
ncbi:MAG: hypothetical protein P5702_13425 [Limnospira sp. PMC 1291.21]|uniref:Uncharacterized protein n=1 Tax=Limnospira fusiformis PMC 851.14 TaxID=2219512 RepID=A0ABU9ESN0_LIMFS|nr:MULTISPECIES: hypothetical protein [Limnospira]MDT9178017.1 hypothetical protein [Limnospira sp. PMC 1238.20]MDT9189636.1 hypothetical protein [Limnospira sp. PMC 894.15]MDT9195248.1 hypothetical protein [Limnospira sp. PMC 1245.20]MDT9198831.1 hypothetical protein [Limnospira sp. PMC 1042.18]MDT9206454.1 hypothetical protein [Limnospira sp. PMC 1243.20]